MGLIKKKTAVRTTEGGIKYICDICSADITATVRIRCADDDCSNYDLCVPCFGEGKSSGKHDPATHPFQVIEQHSIPIYVEDWGADEELLLLEGAETYGLGSWADIADHIGGYRTKDEVRDHYIETYINSSKFPLPERASPKDTTLSDSIPRDEFQARKKRRIEERKEAAKNQAIIDSKQKPTSSVPSCHEVQGFMPGRLEFETEYFNEAEEAVQHMQFEPGDGINPVTGELEPEMDLKITVMDIYNHRLTARVERKKVLFEHNLLEYRKNTAIDKKKTKDERDLSNKTKPFARMMNHSDFEAFTTGIEYEHSIRQAIKQLQDWRRMQIGDLKSGEKYEVEKAARQARAAATADRFSMPGRVHKPSAQEPPSAASALIGPELPPKPNTTGLQTPPESTSPNASNTNAPPRFPLQAITGVSKMDLHGNNSQDAHLLTENEQEICRVIRVQPKAYLVMKDAVLKEALRSNGCLKRKNVKEVCRIDTTKAGKLFDFFVWSGWIGKG
ncbi:putative SAGA complex subunit, partial [Aureobasidium melanogenum]